VSRSSIAPTSICDPNTTLEVLLSLKPYFRKDGLVTAGNASGIVDGAAATVIASTDYAKAHGLKPLGRLVSWAVVGVEPKYMGSVRRRRRVRRCRRPR